MAQPVRLRARVSKVVDHAQGLRSLWLKPERRVPRFRPGHFLHLALDPYIPSEHWPDSRCFSIASPPEDRQEVRITISAVGRFTRRMMDVRVDDEVWLKLPYGDFVVDSPAGQTVVLVAGGTGIAPYMSMLSSSSPRPFPIRLVYGVRRPDLLVYAEELDAAASRRPTFAWKAAVEEGWRPSDIPGRISTEAVLEAAEGATARFYLAGPPPMIEALQTGLVQAGVAHENILVDAWT